MSKFSQRCVDFARELTYTDLVRRKEAVMDQKKIGRFIAERRKNVDMTQVQLAEKLNITDRAVSKWENGLAMPDTSIMLDLCAILKISADELLRGELANGGHFGAEKKVKLFLKLFLTVKSIPSLLGILAFVFSLFTYGAIGYDSELSMKFGLGIKRRLIHFITGGGKLYGSDGKVVYNLFEFSGASLFGVISFVCLAASILLFLIYVFSKKEGLFLSSSISLLLSGAAILLVAELGTKIYTQGGSYNMRNMFRIYYFGAGTILWFILCGFGGGFGIYRYIAEKRKKQLHS